VAIQDIEKLGVFYLGRAYDVAAGRPLAEPLLYDARDLTTHAVCLGMTGSGKTGLCVALLEEAALDGIPAIAIDPKGDLGNLLLTFPELRADDFLPWIDEAEAARAGLDAAAYAAQAAERWRRGLAESGQDGARIERLRAAVDVAIYTPGSASGRPLSVLGSLSAPSPVLAADAEARRERLLGTVSALLSLVGVDADPLRSREHILVAKLVEAAWAEGRDVDLATLVREIYAPPFEQVGALDLESFFPARERAGLGLALNNLLASSGFDSWRQGEALDVAQLLYTTGGQPRLTILSIAHLSEAERMFFVALLLGEVVAWMRTQPGTSSLRAILYMDEVAGYLPPVANPPSKPPMLTLLKQARAFGLGVVLATQNPVDLDYKALTNAGTWFLGRLQTERDKARVLEGLEGAATAAGRGIDRAHYDALLSRLGSRVFLMNDVHEAAPVTFQTRWTLSYLRGPLTRPQIQRLTTPPSDPAPRQPTRDASAEPRLSRPADLATGGRPLLPHGVREGFLAARRARPDDAELLYRPAVLGTARLHYVRAASAVDVWEDCTVVADLDTPEAIPDWPNALAVQGEPPLAADPEPDAVFARLPAPAFRAKSYAAWTRSLGAWLHRTRRLELRRCTRLDLTSRPGESEADFRVRLAHAARERLDAEKQRLLVRYGPRFARLEDRAQRARRRLARESAQYEQSRTDSLVSIGASVLGAVLGRRVASTTNVGRARAAARSLGRTSRERSDVAVARQEIEEVRAQRAELDAELAEAEASLTATLAPDVVTIDVVRVPPRRGDLAIEPLSLVWVPAWIASRGAETKAWP
jgi:Helicase HerA, central domain